MKSTTIKMAEESKVLNTPGAEKQTKRELFDALRQELELDSSLFRNLVSCIAFWLGSCVCGQLFVKKNLSCFLAKTIVLDLIY